MLLDSFVKSSDFDYIKHGVSKSWFISPMHGEDEFEVCGCGKRALCNCKMATNLCHCNVVAQNGFYLDTEEANWEVWSCTSSCPHSQCSMDQTWWTMGMVI